MRRGLLAERLYHDTDALLAYRCCAHKEFNMLAYCGIMRLAAHAGDYCQVGAASLLPTPLCYAINAVYVDHITPGHHCQTIVVTSKELMNHLSLVCLLSTTSHLDTL